MSRAGWTLGVATAALAALAGIAIAGFDGPQTVTVADGPAGVAVGQVTGSKRADVVVASRDAGVISVLPGRPSGMGQPHELAFPGQPLWVARGRIDRGRRADLLVSDVAKPESVVVMLQRPGGGFRKRRQDMRLPVGDVGLGDVNGDGRTDLVALSSADPPAVSVRFQKTNGRFRRALLRTAGDPDGDLENLAVADLNRDGRADVAASDRLAGEVNVLYAKRRGLRARKQLAAGLTPTGIASGRIDPGRTPDLVVANRGGGDVSVFYGNPNGKLEPAVDYPVVAEIQVDVAIANVDGGRRDLITTADFADAFFVLSGEPGGFAPAQELPTPDGIQRVGAGQIDGDGGDDFAAASFSDDSVTAYFGG